MTEPTTIGPSSFDLFDNERCWRPSRRDIIEAVRACQPATVAEVTDVACPPSERWRLRGTVRNRLYELETIGAVVCDDERPMRFMLDEEPSAFTDMRSRITTEELSRELLRRPS